MPRLVGNPEPYAKFWRDELDSLEGKFRARPDVDRLSQWSIVDCWSRYYGGLIFRLRHRTYGFTGNLFTFSDRSARALRAALNGWV